MNGTNDIKLRDFAEFARPNAQGDYPLGVLLSLLALGVLGFGIRLSFLLLVGGNLGGIRWVGTLSLIGFLFLWKTGASLRVNTRKRLRSDDRQALLYLRPFFHERPDSPHEPNDGSVLGSYFETNRRTRLRKIYDLLAGHGADRDPELVTDGAIATAVSEVGPLVAVGIPNELLPPPGALRLYFDDDEWQDKVRELTSISRLAIIQTGYTSSIEWEMDLVRSAFSPDQLYLSLLGWKRLKHVARRMEFGLLQMQLKRLFGVTLKDEYFNSQFLYFEPNWQPVGTSVVWWLRLLLGGPSILMKWFPFFGSAPAAVARESLRPIFRARGMQLSAWRTPAFLLAFYGIGGSGLGYLIFLLLDSLAR
jgi:hypothetical protein